MDQDTYILLSIFLFILRIIITIYCTNKAGRLGKSKLGWGLFGFLLPLIALIWIQFVKPKKSVQSSGSQINKSSSTNGESIQNLERSLKKLKEKQLLTDTEYNEKIVHLKSQEKELNIKQKTERLNELVNSKIKTTLSELDTLLSSGFLSNDEFIEKKTRLHESSYQYYKSFPYINPDCHLQMKVTKKTTLQIFQQKQINEALPHIKMNQVIVLNKLTGQLEKMTMENFFNIDNSDSQKNYLCIDLFD